MVQYCRKGLPSLQGRLGGPSTYGETLNCTRETGNTFDDFDPFAVSMEKCGNVVGHMKRK